MDCSRLNDAHAHLTGGFVGFLKFFFAYFCPALNGSRRFELWLGENLCLETRAQGPECYQLSEYTSH